MLSTVVSLLQHNTEVFAEQECVYAMSFDESCVNSSGHMIKARITFYDTKSKVQCAMIHGMVGA